MTFLRWLKMWWSRVIAGIALTGVASATGVISYKHIYALSIVLHQPPLVARLMPVGIDGLIVIGSVVLLQATADHPYLGWFGVAPGIGASVFANIESGIAYGWLAAMWAGVPAAGFALATFLLERWLKSQVTGVVTGGSAAPTRDGGTNSSFTDSSQCPHGVARTPEEAVTLTLLHGRDCLREAPSQRQLSATWNISRPRVAELVGSLNGSGPRNEGEPGNDE